MFIYLFSFVSLAFMLSSFMYATPLLTALFIRATLGPRRQNSIKENILSSYISELITLKSFRFDAKISSFLIGKLLMNNDIPSNKCVSVLIGCIRDANAD